MDSSDPKVSCGSAKEQFSGQARNKFKKESCIRYFVLELCKYMHYQITVFDNDSVTRFAKKNACLQICNFAFG
jgi:hypothetical protein